MLDWFSGTLAWSGRHLCPDVVYRIDRDGSVVWSKECWIEVEGSFSDKLQLRSVVNPLPLFADRSDGRLSTDLLQMSGNPTKFLQGHNAFGVSVCQLEDMLRATVIELPEALQPQDIASVAVKSSPIVRKSRVDIATSINMGTHEEVHTWLQSVVNASRSRHGRPLVSGDTVYWGKHSRRWTMKAYCKFCEMGQHPMADLKKNSIVREFTKGLLRLELTLRGHEFENVPILEEDVLWKYFDRIEMGVLEMARIKEVEGLPWAMQATILKWLQGEDVRMLLKKPTFYRHRRTILDMLGVDVSLPVSGQKLLLERIKYDGKYLREHEVKKLPTLLNSFIYRPAVQLCFSST